MMAEGAALAQGAVAGGIGGLCVAGAVTLAVSWVRGLPDRTRASAEMKRVDLDERQQLWARITALEAAQEKHAGELERERDDCERRIERIEVRSDAALAELRAEMRVVRHDRNNLQQAFNSLLMLIKRMDHPDLQGAAQMVEEMLTRGEQAVALERGAAAGASTRRMEA